MIRRFLLTIPALLALAACGAGAPPPDETYYRLGVAPPNRVLDHPALPGTLEIDRVETEGVLSERAIAFQSGGDALQRYHYAFWTETPGLMLQDLLASRLREVHAATAVVTPDLRAVPDWILRAKLHRFEFRPQDHAVSVALDVAVVGANNGVIRLQQSYDVQDAAGGDGPEAAAGAIGRAVSRILDRLVADLAGS